MIFSFKNDYAEGAHPKILDAIAQTNWEQQDGYGEDAYCCKARDLIKKKVDDPNANIHFVSGGTQANAIVISAMLKSYESVISADTGHINVHEAGAVESHGHKVNTVKNADGKLLCTDIASVVETHTDEHMVRPKMVYLSNATETGSIYTRSELEEISVYCRKNSLFLYLDGARLGCALTAFGNDLTLPALHRLVDVYYIGGTKNGALMGEAVVIRNDRFKKDFRFHLKRNGALLSKSRMFGLQFYELFQSDLYFEMADHANKMAMKLAAGMKEMGIEFFSKSVTNQIFPVFPDAVIEKLHRSFSFYVWQKMANGASAVRLVTSWATKEERVDLFLDELEKLIWR